MKPTFRQSAPARSLGANDPRTRRNAAQFADVPKVVAKPLTVKDGKLTLEPARGIADVSLGAVTDPVDSPADADALRDDLVTNTIPSIEARLAALQEAHNGLLDRLRTAGLLRP